MILKECEAPKAAAHYAKRLQLRGEELLTVITSGVQISPLLMAQFMVELEEDTLAIGERLQLFLWPWLLQSQEENEDETRIKTAMHLILHPTTSDNAKMYEKKECGWKLQRAIVIARTKVSTGCITVTGACIPIVHFRDPSANLPCDLCVNNVPTS